LASLVFILFIPPVAAQKAKLSNTLLWRITGKAGAKPSYLFGTMHVKDRRVFQFSGSLYHSLQKAEGFAMEIDPDEAMAALFKTFSDPDTTALLRDEMKGEDFEKVAGDLKSSAYRPTALQKNKPGFTRWAANTTRAPSRTIW
jgi:uncharacterized protein YbaP (TraB family)